VLHKYINEYNLKLVWQFSESYARAEV